MGVYIKGFIPTDGLYQIKDGVIWKYKAKGGTVRPYELVEVKEPHGRLIDADALKSKVLEWMPSDPCGIEEREFPLEADIVASLMMEIEEAPTIEPEPHWIPCNERMPEWNTRVLFYLEKECYYDYPEPQYVTDWWIQEGLFNDKYGAYVYDSPDIGKGIPKDYVVAWMPLPKPWKGDK